MLRVENGRPSSKFVGQAPKTPKKRVAEPTRRADERRGPPRSRPIACPPNGAGEGSAVHGDRRAKEQTTVRLSFDVLGAMGLYTTDADVEFGPVSVPVARAKSFVSRLKWPPSECTLLGYRH
jgi:hypothetical protein